MEMARVRTATSKILVVIAVAMAGTLPLHAQSSGQTIRHHKIAVEDPNAANLAQAETAIQNKDLSSAFDLLNKVIAADPKNYEAWFDLGYVNNALGKTSDAIAAYRQSVSAKPDVFESNLNLGLMLERAGQPGAEPFLRAATKLTPTAHAAESKEQAWLALGHALEKSSPAEAVEAFQEASKLQPNDGAADDVDHQRAVGESRAQDFRRVAAHEITGIGAEDCAERNDEKATELFVHDGVLPTEFVGVISRRVSAFRPGG
jgi:Flp pilus assembly protein TadD